MVGRPYVLSLDDGFKTYKILNKGNRILNFRIVKFLLRLY